MTNSHWDVIFMITQGIFCMPANDAEGITDDDGDDWLAMNDEKQGFDLSLLCTHR